MKEKKEVFFGFYDSGIGGLSVLSDALKSSVIKNALYLSDAKFAPYGNLAIRKLKERAIVNVSKLISYGADNIVLSCNTLSVNLFFFLKKTFPLVKFYPVFPPVETYLLKGERTLLLATAKTCEVYKEGKFLDVFPLYKLASDIEKNAFNLDKVNLGFHLKGVKKNYQNVILGCTHYFFLIEKFKECFPESKIIFSNDNLLNAIKKDYPETDKKSPKNLLFIGDYAEKNRKIYQKYFEPRFL